MPLLCSHFIILLIYQFLAVLDPCCCMWAFSSSVSRCHSLDVQGLLTALASLVAEQTLEHGLSSWGCCCCCVTSVVSDSVRPHRRQPTRLPCPWDSPGKNTGVACHFLLHCMKMKSESEVAQSCPALTDPMDCSFQAPLSMGFSRREHWSGVPLPSLQ